MVATATLAVIVDMTVEVGVEAVMVDVVTYTRAERSLGASSQFKRGTNTRRQGGADGCGECGCLERD